MNTSLPDPAVLADLLVRLRAGDAAARNELTRQTYLRVEALARAMLRKFPSVRRWADTGDVFQNASLRLLRALETTPVSDARGYLNLAAAVIRTELLDLARRFAGPHGLSTNQAAPFADDGPPAPDAGDAGDLDRWTALHEAVEQLPIEEREVFLLTFYHKWSQAQIAELFHVDVRTVRRRWQAATARLTELVGGECPTE